MLRKLTLGAVAAIGMAFCGQEASAAPPGFVPQGGYGGGYGSGFGGILPPQRYDTDFVVYVAHRHGDHIHWERYGRFETRREAERAEYMLERRGLRARIEVVQDRRRY